MADPQINDFYLDLKRRAHYLQIINELALGLLQQSSMDDILWLVAKSAIAQLGFLDCVIYLVDESGQVLQQRAAHGPKNPVAKEILDPIAIPVGQGIVGTVATTGKPELISNTRADPRYITDDEARLSELAVPIFFENKVIGVIDSEHPDADFYTGEHLEIMTTIASMAATKIASALAIERLQDSVDELHKVQEELQYHASHDPLTGLYNRREFEIRLSAALLDAREHDNSHVLGYMDVDLFKVVNDTYGHMAGDHLLRHLGLLLESYQSPSDIVARLGGDEFGLLMLNCDEPEARRRIEWLQRKVNDTRFRWHDQSFAVGVSIGLYRINAACPSEDAAMTMADTACLMAKETGRNRLHVYRESDASTRRHHMETHWVFRLNQALEEDRFQLYCQPIVPINPPDPTSSIHEVLLRLVDQQEGLILPGDFIPAAERFGLATRLDRYVISRSMESLARFLPQLPPKLMACINISAMSLGQPDFYEHIVTELERTGIPGTTICIEITETATIANYAQASTLIHRLKRHGCRFAIDDFGSGMTTIGYLRNLPVDFIKLDGSLIRRIPSDPIDQTLVTTIIRIARMLNVRTVAEHVESEAVVSLLSDLGVDYLQGYWMGRPVPMNTMLQQQVALV